MAVTAVAASKVSKQKGGFIRWSFQRTGLRVRRCYQHGANDGLRLRGTEDRPKVLELLYRRLLPITVLTWFFADLGVKCSPTLLPSIPQVNGNQQTPGLRVISASRLQPRQQPSGRRWMPRATTRRQDAPLVSATSLGVPSGKPREIITPFLQWRYNAKIGPYKTYIPKSLVA
jgi:hypothetical protein